MCKRLWTEETVTHHGEFFSFDEVVFEPKPVQQPWPPILVGGESKAALRRAARLGDGWLGMGHTFESAAAQIDDAARAARGARPAERRRPGSRSCSAVRSSRATTCRAGRTSASRA